MRAFDQIQFRRACSAYATGVTIVTTTDRAGAPVGLTVNSFTSVSLEPPLVLWCVGGHSRSFETFSSASHYAVHVLHKGQQDLARRFAGRDEDKFTGLVWRRGELGSPILPEFSACFQCTMHAVHPAGNQNILVGRVVAIEDRGDADATLYFRGQYRELG